MRDARVFESVNTLQILVFIKKQKSLKILKYSDFFVYIVALGYLFRFVVISSVASCDIHKRLKIFP